MPNLTSLHGLENATPAWIISLGDCPVLTDISALAGIQTVTTVSLRRLGLANLAGLQDLRTVELLTLEELAIEDVDALAGIESVRDVEIRNNDSLVELDALAHVTWNRIDFSGNALLTSAPPLRYQGAAVTAMGTHFVDLAGMAGTTTLSRLELQDNPDLVSLAGLEDLVSADVFDVGYSQNLTSLSALGKLEYVRWLRFWSTGVTTMSRLGALASVGDDLVIGWNPSLQSLSGLDNLTHVGALWVSDNPVLPACEPEALAARLSIACGCSNNNGSGGCGG